MICKQCKDEGNKSTIYHGSSTSTCMATSEYYDEEGIYHEHDLNSYSNHYKCSNGHEFSMSRYRKCPSCDFNN